MNKYLKHEYMQVIKDEYDNERRANQERFRRLKVKFRRTKNSGIAVSLWRTSASGSRGSRRITHSSAFKQVVVCTYFVLLRLPHWHCLPVLAPRSAVPMPSSLLTNHIITLMQTLPARHLRIHPCTSKILCVRVRM